MNVEYYPGTTEGRILLIAAQVNAIRRILQEEALFTLKEIHILMSLYQKDISNFLDICNALHRGEEVNCNPYKVAIQDA